MKNFILFTKILSLFLGGILIGYAVHLQICYPPRYFGESIWLIIHVICGILLIIYGKKPIKK